MASVNAKQDPGYLGLNGRDAKAATPSNMMKGSHLAIQMKTKITKEDAIEPPTPKSALHANSYPKDGFSLLVDGKFKSHYPTFDEAKKVGAILKDKYPFLQIAVRDAVTAERSLVELPSVTP